MISFARGVPGPDCLPIEEIGTCTLAVLQREERDAPQYGPPSGFPPLRKLLAERHGVEPERVFISNGSLQGLAFLWQHLLRGDNKRVLVEAPTYDRPLKILNGLGAEIDGMPDGRRRPRPPARTRSRTRSLRSCTRSRPSRTRAGGRSRSSGANALVELAEERDLLVIEDDPYGLVRFEGEPLPSLLELAPAGRVIYSCSFSKTVAPGLRVGYLDPPARSRRRGRGDRGVHLRLAAPSSPQAIVWEFLRTRPAGAEPRSRGREAARAARRDAGSARARAPRCELEPPRGRLLHLARPAGRRGLGASCSRRPRRTA